MNLKVILKDGTTKKKGIIFQYKIQYTNGDATDWRPIDQSLPSLSIREGENVHLQAKLNGENVAFCFNGLPKGLEDENLGIEWSDSQKLWRLFLKEAPEKEREIELTLLDGYKYSFKLLYHPKVDSDGNHALFKKHTDTKFYPIKKSRSGDDDTNADLNEGEKLCLKRLDSGQVKDIHIRMNQDKAYGFIIHQSDLLWSIVLVCSADIEGRNELHPVPETNVTVGDDEPDSFSILG